MLNKKYYIKIHVYRDAFRRRNSLLHEADETIEKNKADKTIKADEPNKADKPIETNKANEADEADEADEISRRSR